MLFMLLNVKTKDEITQYQEKPKELFYLHIFFNYFKMNIII